MTEIQQIEAPSALISDPEKTEQEKKYIKNVLKDVICFRDLPKDFVDTIVTQMKLFALESGSLVYSQGSVGQNFFIVREGKIEVLINGDLRGYYEKGKAFGELALMQEYFRRDSILTVEKSLL